MLAYYLANPTSRRADSAMKALGADVWPDIDNQLKQLVAEGRLVRVKVPGRKHGQWAAGEPTKLLWPVSFRPWCGSAING